MAIKVSGSPCLGQGTWKVELTPSFYFISTDIISDPYLIRSCRVGRPKRPRTSDFFTLQSSALTNRRYKRENERSREIMRMADASVRSFANVRITSATRVSTQPDICNGGFGHHGKGRQFTGPLTLAGDFYPRALNSWHCMAS